jgi:hypothetical protein
MFTEDMPQIRAELAARHVEKGRGLNVS